MKRFFFLIIILYAYFPLSAEDGYRLWLRYDKIADDNLLKQYQSLIIHPALLGQSPTLEKAKAELQTGLSGLFGKPVSIQSEETSASTLLIGNTVSSPSLSSFLKTDDLASLGKEGFLIISKKNGNRNRILLVANSDVGILYGVFHLLRLIQTHQSLLSLNIRSVPAMPLRMLNHWDNLDRTVERGYAGFSIWKWHTLPDYLDPRYTDYARANASLGINATVLTNVNANAAILTPAYLKKVKALADLFRPYGIRVFLTARFSAPIEIGNLKTADPLDPDVKKWWKEKAREIYQLIPDFGGFLVKANSEGQPGPQKYGRTHADGANLLAEAVAPFKGQVIWRAFVYSSDDTEDRHNQAYKEFLSLDGQFLPNVILQVKNGPIDFMPREPFHPLFGAMKKTPVIVEFQITQEYLGQGTHLVFLAPLFKECLESDTYCQGKGSTVKKLVEGKIYPASATGMAGVSNIGNDINWCGHPFAQANWYAFGRLSWNPDLSSQQIAEEWLRMTYSQDADFLKEVSEMMLRSREILVHYMNPIGLHHLMGTGHHYGPAPWIHDLSRPEWNPVYYHRADSAGIGFDRTQTGSNAIASYQPEVRKQWEDPATCDERFLLWFHHMPWNYKMKDSRTVWEELCFFYDKGVQEVGWMKMVWKSQGSRVDSTRFREVSMLLDIQEKEARWWRNACLLYFQTFSNRPFPDGFAKPDHTLQEYEALSFPYAPGH